MNKIREIKKKAKCCSCEGSLRGSHLNQMILMKKATWKYPTWKNPVLSDGPLAAAILCDGCTKFGNKPKFAIEWDNNTLKITYHPVDKLEDIPQEAFDKLPPRKQVGA